VAGEVHGGRGCTPMRRWGCRLIGDGGINDFCSGSTMHDSGNGYIRGYPLSAGNGYGYDFLSVTGKRYGFRYVVKVTDMDI
jgi:hypothetical protein